jgi:surfactin synthase thioesterase subunit
LLGGSSDVVVAPAMLRGREYHGDDFAIRVVPGGHLLPEDAPDLVAAAARSLFGQVSGV